ncbi:GFA family protein [Pseudomarimonas arenosa]|uniref:GFA family protein n=1 Tax=Pseudomarimonas arenosa TaxID=2774145 RepID=A0AAW3ZW06_9GAMM|nr:GFA family protein [Pseudomarimonas arenosa]MBD8528216.1 GFA family protein [Pseudomarimonas arenosa]
MIKHQGGCHCGAVRFEVEAPVDIEALDCNCSLCAKAGFLHLIVPKARFHLLQGESELSEYRFGTGVARHLFCRHCGVKSFYVPRSNPDGIDVNVRCIDSDTVRSLKVETFDGKSAWEEQAASISHLSST